MTKICQKSFETGGKVGPNDNFDQDIEEKILKSENRNFHIWFLYKTHRNSSRTLSIEKMGISPKNPVLLIILGINIQ